VGVGDGEDRKIKMEGIFFIFYFFNEDGEE